MKPHSNRKSCLQGLLSRFVLLIAVLLFVSACTQVENAPYAVSDNKVSYSLGQHGDVVDVYPDPSWLPEPYKKYYTTLEDTIKYYTESSLNNDGIKYESVNVWKDKDDNMIVEITSTDPAAGDYAAIHPDFIENYRQALVGINKCKSDEGCWNKGNTHQDEPWAFFPQFGMAMAKQKSVLLLNYPPASALTNKSYLDTFTMSRWGRVLSGAGSADPELFEVIVDVRPIAAPASGTSKYLPDANQYFNDPDGKTGGYYITPQLNLLLDPPANLDPDYTLPVVVLGSPARYAWSEITGTSYDLLSTGRVTLEGTEKSTPYILGNHPTVSTYQCCPGSTYDKCSSFSLIEDEQIDFQVTCWVNAMASDLSQNPSSVLASCKEQWVKSPTPENEAVLCTSAVMDNDACYPNAPNEAQARAYCKRNDNKPCPKTSSGCPITQ